MAKTVKDFRLADGTWAAGYTAEGIQYITKLMFLFNGMKSRCKEGGYCQRTYPTYTGCTHTFTDFQDFAEWAVQQVGYGVTGFALDKDILFPGNKVYSKDTCVFVPQEINKLFSASGQNNGGLPLGVIKKHHKFEARMCIRGKQTTLGSFYCANEAGSHYAVSKENLVKELAEEYKGKVDKRVYEAMKNFSMAGNLARIDKLQVGQQ